LSVNFSGPKGRACKSPSTGGPSGLTEGGPEGTRSHGLRVRSDGSVTHCPSNCTAHGDVDGCIQVGRQRRGAPGVLEVVSGATILPVDVPISRSLLGRIGRGVVNHRHTSSLSFVVDGRPEVVKAPGVPGGGGALGTVQVADANELLSGVRAPVRATSARVVLEIRWFTSVANRASFLDRLWGVLWSGPFGRVRSFAVGVCLGA